jgi:hypothetical protein
MASSFLIYALHYVIVRTIYDGLLAHGASAVILAMVAVGLLALLWVLHRAAGGRER